MSNESGDTKVLSSTTSTSTEQQSEPSTTKIEPVEPPPVKTLPNGPQPDVRYPIKTVYCGVCSLPPEYCEYNNSYEECKEWLEKTMPDLFAKLEAAENKDSPSRKAKQKRGGKALPKIKKKEVDEQFIKLSRANRGKKKFVTFVQGLNSFEIDLKEATKFFSSRFACGSSISGPDEIIIQGDVKDDLWDVIPEKWQQIEEDFIEDLGDVKR